MNHISCSSVLVITHFPFPHFGGVSTAISNEMVFFTNKGYKMYLMYPPSEEGGNIKWRHNNLCLIPQNPSSNAILNVINKIRRCSTIKRVMNNNQIKKVIAHDVHSAFLCVLAGKGRNTLLYLHSIMSKDPLVFGKGFSNRTLSEKVSFFAHYYVNLSIELFTYNLVRAVVCVSEYEEKDAELKCLTNKKIHLIRNGVDTSVFKPDLRKRMEMRRFLNVAYMTKVCMFLGRMNPSKGLSTIAKSIEYLDDLKQEVFFVFVGEGPEEEIVKNYTQRMGFENVTFLRPIPAREILPMADIFVSHVSSVIVGYGRTILEAMASKIPVVTGRDFIKEKVFVEDEEIVFVRKDDPESIAERIRELALNDRKRRIIGEKARKKVLKEFAIEGNMEKLERISNLSIIS